MSERTLSLQKELPKISIIVPVYNVIDELDRCIKSLIMQSDADIEIILVDDGSTDGCGVRCDEWAQCDQRISVIHKPNGGLSSARNAGIEAACGSYLGFVDSDDYVEPDMFATLYRAIHETGADIACCGRFVHTDIGIQKRFTANPGTIFNRDSAFKEVLAGSRIDVSAWDKLYRRSLFDHIRYPEGRISEDAAIILPLLFNANEVVHVGKPLYHYVFRSGSISKATYSHHKYDVMTNCIEMKAFAKSYEPALMRYVNSYCCTQMAAMIEDIINTPDGKKIFALDYRAYWDLFRDSYSDYREVSGHEHKELVRIVLTRAHLYPLFWMLRKIRNEVKRRVR